MSSTIRMENELCSLVAGGHGTSFRLSYFLANGWQLNEALAALSVLEQEGKLDLTVFFFCSASHFEDDHVAFTQDHLTHRPDFSEIICDRCGGHQTSDDPAFDVLANVNTSKFNLPVLFVKRKPIYVVSLYTKNSANRIDASSRHTYGFSFSLDIAQASMQQTSNNTAYACIERMYAIEETDNQTIDQTFWYEAVFRGDFDRSFVQCPSPLTGP